MRLAEALILRADSNTRLSQVRERLLRVVKVQEGDAPAEDPIALLREHAELCATLEDLIARINRTNLSTPVGEGTMTDALARRDARKIRIEALRAAVAAASAPQTRGLRTEIRMVATIPVREIQGECDRLSREAREAEATIQEANWAHDLAP